MALKMADGFVFDHCLTTNLSYFGNKHTTSINCFCIPLIAAIVTSGDKMKALKRVLEIDGIDINKESEKFGTKLILLFNAIACSFWSQQHHANSFSIQFGIPLAFAARKNKESHLKHLLTLKNIEIDKDTK